jgi:EAL domain-containing protein (putative c-di-GMP-specific phosphodiesterase class I)
VARALKDSGLPGDRLELELTEGMLMEQPEAASATMAALKQMGVRLSLDDFGTGYSSLSYLKRFPFDALKIDQSFVRDLGSNADDDSLVRTIILMAKNLNMRAIAEGVETSTQLDFLSANECDEFQGFLRSQAVPASELEKLIRES